MNRAQANHFGLLVCANDLVQRFRGPVFKAFDRTYRFTDVWQMGMRSQPNQFGIGKMVRANRSPLQIHDLDEASRSASFAGCETVSFYPPHRQLAARRLHAKS